MKIYYSATSPFVRKCLVGAQELGLRGRIELVPATPHPVDRDRAVIAHNPLGKIPTLIADDGTVLYDSRVICDYLNSFCDGLFIVIKRWPTASWKPLSWCATKPLRARNRCVGRAGSTANSTK